MENGIQCPECGHQLSTFRVAEPERGERTAAAIADRVATWWFPTSILVGVLLWALVNIIARPLDPYPVVVLAWISAVLATVAACQGPLILLAQRRAAMHDRERDEEVFRVATNTEEDLHALDAKLDLLRSDVRSLNNPSQTEQ